MRNTRRSDIAGLQELFRASYPALSEVATWKPKQWKSHLRLFPQGQWVALDDDRPVGCTVNFLTTFETVKQDHTWISITERGMLTGHDPLGDTLYGAEIMVDPAYRRRGIAKRLYRVRMDWIREHNVRYFCAGGRLPQFASRQRRDGYSLREYVRLVIKGQLTDRTLTAQLRSGLRVERLLPNYLEDPKSDDAAVLLVWANPDYDRTRPTSVD